MRILTVGNMYPPHHLGGYELVWQAAVHELRRAGHAVRVLTTDHREAGALADDDPDAHRDLRWFWRDHEFPRLPQRERRAIERHNHATFDRHLAEFRPDALSWWAMGGMSMSLLRRSGLPAIGWVNDEWLIYGPKVDAARRASVRRPGILGAARWVFPSRALEQAVRGFHPHLGDTVVEPQGVASEFRARPAPPWRARLLYAGRLDPRKGVDTAIEALPSAPGATLRIVGGGDEREGARLRELAQRLGVTDRVTFSAAVSRARLVEEYAAADATVFPVKWFEPYGLVPLESMAVGRPVLATGTGGSGDYLRDGENALLFAPGDPKALAAAIARLADDGLRARLRAGGLATAAELTEARWLAAVRREHEALSAA